MQGFNFLAKAKLCRGRVTINSIYYAIFSVVHCRLSLLSNTTLDKGDNMQIICGSPDLSEYHELQILRLIANLPTSRGGCVRTACSRLLKNDFRQPCCSSVARPKI